MEDGGRERQPSIGTIVGFRIPSRQKRRGLRALCQLSALSLVPQRRHCLATLLRAFAWTETAKVVEIYSDNTVKRWKEEIDTHLVFVSAQCSIYPLTTADAHNAGRSLFGRRYGIQRPIISTSTTPRHRPYSSSVADDFTPTGKF